MTVQTRSIILLGAGGVGRALLRHIVANRGLHATQFGLRLDVLAVCDSNGAVVALGGDLDDAALLDIVRHKEVAGALVNHPLGGPQNDLSAIVDIAGRSGAIVVDCTATDTTVPALLYALEKQYKLVMANKKPLSDDQEIYDRLTRAGATTKTTGTRDLNRARWETTCGAALPVIATVNRLLSSGDRVERIAGAFSGTLGFVMTGLQAGQSFSAVVREAHRLGYTEPDPRDDLNGIDVARKALILARGLGWSLELDDVAITGLYPAAMDAFSVDEFLTALPELDADLRQQAERAAASGKVLRYTAVIADGRCEVGPSLVDADSPLGRLNGTDNLVEFSTHWYSPMPLVVQGAGAGTDITAAGVLSDIVELACMNR